jgi:hypothetical protein
MLRIFTHLDLLDLGEADILRIAATHDLSRRSPKALVEDPHVTNNTQRRRTFDDVFKEEHFRLVRELFPEDLLSRLGYELASDEA